MTRANWTSATAWPDRPPPFHPWKLFFKAYPTKSLSLPLYPTIFSLYPSGLSHSLSDFRALFGTSPYRYLIQRRLDIARRLMLGGQTLAEAALAAGFADQSHMTRHFGQSYGLPPARWLRMLGRA